MEDLKMIDRLETRRFNRRLLTLVVAAGSVSLLTVIGGLIFTPSHLEQCAQRCAVRNQSFSWSEKARTPPGQPDVPERCECRSDAEVKPISGKVEAPVVTPWGGTMIRSDENGTVIYSVKP